MDLCARDQFKVMLGESSILIGVCQALDEYDGELPAINIALNETQVIRQAEQILCIYIDGIVRPCTVCWIMDSETRQHQFMAFARHMIPPRVRAPEEGHQPFASVGASVADVCKQGASLHYRSGILLDSGANEILRQQERKPPRSTHLPLTLANGEAIDAYRTREGEVVIVGSNTDDVI